MNLGKDEGGERESERERERERERKRERESYREIKAATCQEYTDARSISELLGGREGNCPN